MPGHVRIQFLPSFKNKQSFYGGIDLSTILYPHSGGSATVTMANETEKHSLPDHEHSDADVPAGGSPGAKQHQKRLVQRRRKFFQAMKELLNFSREDVDGIYQIPESNDDITEEIQRSTDKQEIRKLRNEVLQEMNELQRSQDKIMKKMNEMSKQHEKSERRLIQ